VQLDPFSHPSAGEYTMRVTPFSSAESSTVTLTSAARETLRRERTTRVASTSLEKSVRSADLEYIVCYKVAADEWKI
jgi:hypothetical protein